MIQSKSVPRSRSFLYQPFCVRRASLFQLLSVLEIWASAWNICFDLCACSVVAAVLLGSSVLKFSCYVVLLVQHLFQLLCMLWPTMLSYKCLFVRISHSSRLTRLKLYQSSVLEVPRAPTVFSFSRKLMISDAPIWFSPQPAEFKRLFPRVFLWSCLQGASCLLSHHTCVSLLGNRKCGRCLSKLPVYALTIITSSLN